MASSGRSPTYVEAHKLLPRRLRAILSRERSNAFTVEMLTEAGASLAALEKLAPRDFALFIEPPSLDDRIVNQFALFAMMSNPEARLDKWLAGQPSGLVRRIIIPAELKWEVRDKLDQANITERVLIFRPRRPQPLPPPPLHAEVTQSLVATNYDLRTLRRRPRIPAR